ncbi:MAG: hypothetical protein AAF411_21150 [Myxococcota bacterium]
MSGTLLDALATTEFGWLLFSSAVVGPFAVFILWHVFQSFGYEAVGSAVYALLASAPLVLLLPALPAYVRSGSWRLEVDGERFALIRGSSDVPALSGARGELRVNVEETEAPGYHLLRVSTDEGVVEIDHLSDEDRDAVERALAILL